MEVTEKIIEGMVQTFADELQQEAMDGRQIVDGAGDFLPALKGIGKIVFGRWASLVRIL